MAKAATEAGRPTWHELFDTGLMDHVCELVRSNVLEVARGIPSSMDGPLRRHALALLDAYIADHREPGALQSHVMAAERFRDRLERLAGLFESGHPFSEPAADLESAALRFAWIEFIAYGAAFLMYWKAPRDRAQRIAAARSPRVRKKGAARGGARVAVAWIESHPGEKLSGLVAELASRAGVAESTVWAWVKRARELKLLR